MICSGWMNGWIFTSQLSIDDEEKELLCCLLLIMFLCALSKKWVRNILFCHSSKTAFHLSVTRWLVLLVGGVRRRVSRIIDISPKSKFGEISIQKMSLIERWQLASPVSDWILVSSLTLYIHPRFKSNFMNFHLAVCKNIIDTSWIQNNVTFN